MDGLASFFLLLLVHSLLDVINGICGRGSQGIQLGDPYSFGFRSPSRFNDHETKKREKGHLRVVADTAESKA